MSFHALAASGSSFAPRQGDAEIDLIDLKDTPAATPRCQPEAEETESVAESPAAYASGAGAQDMHDCEWDKLAIQSPLYHQSKNFEVSSSLCPSASPLPSGQDTHATVAPIGAIYPSSDARWPKRDLNDFTGVPTEPKFDTDHDRAIPVYKGGRDHEREGNRHRHPLPDRPHRVIQEDVVRYTNFDGDVFTALICTYSDDTVVVHGEHNDKARIAFDPVDARKARGTYAALDADIERQRRPGFTLDHYVPRYSILRARPYYRDRYFPPYSKLAGKKVKLRKDWPGSKGDAEAKRRSGQVQIKVSSSMKRRQARQRQKARQRSAGTTSDEGYKSTGSKKACVCGGTPGDNVGADEDTASEGTARPPYLYGVLVENLVHETKTADVELAFSDCGAEPLGVRLVQFMNDSLTMLVLFDNEDVANTAIEQMNGVVADGHELSVSLLPESQEVLLHRLEGGTAME